MRFPVFLRYVVPVLSLVPICVAANSVESVPAQASITVATEVYHDTSPPLREIIANLPAEAPANPAEYVVPNIFLDLDDRVVPNNDAPLPPAQRSVFGSPMPPVGVMVNGMRAGLGGNGVPPDTTGDVGPLHYFQWVNTSWSLYDKISGARIDIPADADDVVPGSSFFAGFGGVCQSTNRGDPLVLWDDIARRWVVSQFAFTSTSTAPWLQCVAVSTSEDPLGSYHRYAFSYPNFNDYGKMGVWVTEDGGQNGYVFSMHEFAGTAFVGSSFAIVERDRMLAGQSARFIRVGGIDAFGAIPFHLEGTIPLPSGKCPVFAHFSFSSPGYNLWDLCVNWNAGTVNFNPQPTFLASEPFTLGLTGIPQLNSTTRLDDFGGNTMYIAAMRAFGPNGPTEAQGVINHAVDVGGDQAGVRWVQFGFAPGSSNAPLPDAMFANGFEDGAAPPPFTTFAATGKRILDQGTYAPDSLSRWMGSISLDQSGNIALGYNVSSATMNPEIRIAGRLRNDAAGSLREESQCSPTGTGAQTGLFSGRARWGDYASMGVDPNDQCTFWFTNEYYTTTSTSSWNTRICSIKFPTCGDPDFLLESIPRTRLPLCAADGAASVRVGAFGTLAGTVALSAGSVPPGVTLGFGTPTLAAGASSTVALIGSGALADGLYTAQVVGTSAPLTRSVNIDFGVSAVAPGTPTLINPVSGSTGNVTRPTYSWGAGSGAVEYFVEVATDAAFTQVIDSAVVSGTSYTSSVLLNSTTQYFWRVTPRNFCGSGTVATTSSFTTGTPGSCPSGTVATQVFFDDVAGDTVAWTTQNVSGDVGTAWSKLVPPAGTGLTTRAWFAGNSSTTGDQRLTSPSIALPSALGNLPIVLAFDAFHNYETDGTVDCWDGGLVEISTNGGSTWTPLGNARNLADPYPGRLSSGNPAVGEFGWCRQPAGGNSVRSIFLLDQYAGEDVQLRFRSTSDSNTVGSAPAGWGVDNILVQSCVD